MISRCFCWFVVLTISTVQNERCGSTKLRSFEKQKMCPCNACDLGYGFWLSVGRLCSSICCIHLLHLRYVVDSGVWGHTCGQCTRYFYSSPNSFVSDMCLSFTHCTSNTTNESPHLSFVSSPLSLPHCHISLLPIY